MQVHFNNRNIMRKKFGKNLLVGGAVPLLLNRVIRTAERMGGSIGSNRIVGIVSPSPDRNNSQVIGGGDLLNTISFAKTAGRKLGLGVKIPKVPSNIKFLF